MGDSNRRLSAFIGKNIEELDNLAEIRIYSAENNELIEGAKEQYYLISYKHPEISEEDMNFYRSLAK